MANRRRKLRPVPPYVAPPDARPLRDVIRQIREKQQKLNQLDDEIGLQLARFEDTARRRRTTGGPVDVPFPPWGKLGWSGRRGHWRLVVLEDDEVCTDLCDMPKLCWKDAIGVLRKLAERMGLL